MSVDLKETMQEEAVATVTKGRAKGNGALLSIQDLRIWFELRRWGFGHAGYVRAVDGVSFDLHHGEAIGVVGESGCGKTTLMKTILGLYQPTQGEVESSAIACGPNQEIERADQE